MPLKFHNLTLSFLASFSNSALVFHGNIFIGKPESLEASIFLPTGYIKERGKSWEQSVKNNFTAKFTGKEPTKICEI